MKISRRVTIVFSLTILIHTFCIAAEDSFYIAPGQHISTDQASEYGLFRDVEGFQGAWFEEDEYKNYLLLIVRFERDSLVQQYTYRLQNSLISTLNNVLIRDSLETEDSGITPPFAILKTADGSTIYGKVVGWTGTAIIFQTDYGTIDVPLEDILSYDERSSVQEEVSSRFGRFVDPNRNRLLFMPTGRSLEKGEGYVSIYEVVMPSATVGIGSNISLGGGILPFISGDFFLGWATVQAGLLDQQDYALAAGALGFGATGGGESTSFGFLYSSGTYGSVDGSITGGLGYGFANGELASRPVISFGGRLRMGRSTVLITENWWLPNVESPLVSVGLRWFGDRFAADFALVRPTWVDIPFLGIPWLGLVYNF